MEFEESLVHCAVREVREETGFEIEISGLIGSHTDPNVLIAYSDGEIRQEFTLVAAKIKSGELTIDHESKQAVWVSTADGLSFTVGGFPAAAVARRGTLSRKAPRGFLGQHAIKYSLNLHRLRDPAASLRCIRSLYPLARLGENQVDASLRIPMWQLRPGL